MITVCYQKRSGVWYGAAAQNNQVLATYFSRKECDLKRLLLRLPYNCPFQFRESDQFLTGVLESLNSIFYGKKTESNQFKINMNHLSKYIQHKHLIMHLWYLYF